MTRQPMWRILNIDQNGKTTMEPGYPQPTKLFVPHIHVKSVEGRLVVTGAHVHEDLAHQDEALKLYWSIAQTDRIPLEADIIEMSVVEFSARAFRVFRTN